MKDMKSKLGILLLFLTVGGSAPLRAQIDLYLSPGYGFGFSKARLDKIQDSYTSYQTYMQHNVPGDPIAADPNWNANELIRCLSFHAGISGEGVMAGIAYFPYRLKQERYIMQTSGFGRKFVWKEARNEWLFDLGFGSKYIDAFLSIGVNFNTYKMLSYQVYPSGAESINNEYTFNGLFMQSDVGMTYGGGLKIKLIPFVALEMRYIYSTDLLPGEKRSIISDPSALADNSFSREPGTNHYPQDYTKPLTLDNEINPNFKRSTLQFSILLYFRQDD